MHRTHALLGAVTYAKIKTITSGNILYSDSLNRPLVWMFTPHYADSSFQKPTLVNLMTSIVSGDTLHYVLSIRQIWIIPHRFFNFLNIQVGQHLNFNLVTSEKRLKKFLQVVQKLRVIPEQMKVRIGRRVGICGDVNGAQRL